MTEDKSEFRQYVIEQIIDYINSQTGNNSVNSSDIKKCEEAVYKICTTAFPEHEVNFSKYVPQIVRAALDAKQLSFADKVQKIVDITIPPKDPVINAIINDISSAKVESETLSKVAQNSWVHKVQTEKSKKQDFVR